MQRSIRLPLKSVTDNRLRDARREIASDIYNLKRLIGTREARLTVTHSKGGSGMHFRHHPDVIAWPKPDRQFRDNVGIERHNQPKSRSAAAAISATRPCLRHSRGDAPSADACGLFNHNQ